MSFYASGFPENMFNHLFSFFYFHLYKLIGKIYTKYLNKKKKDCCASLKKQAHKTSTDMLNGEKEKKKKTAQSDICLSTSIL